MGKGKTTKLGKKKSYPGAKFEATSIFWLRCGGAVAMASAIVIFVASVYGMGNDNDIFCSYDFREVCTYHKSFYKKALLDGRLPLWNPHTFSGWPFLANPLVQAFYPPSLLFLILPQPTAVIIDLIMHLLLGAAGMYLLLRITFVLRRATAAFGALVYALSGSFVGQAYAGHIWFYAAALYAPLLMLAVDQGVAFLARYKASSKEISQRFPRFFCWAGPWLWLGALLLGLQIFSGGLPFVWLTMIMIVLFRLGILLSYELSNWHAWLREMAVLAAMIGIAAGLTAVQLTPTYELAQLSNRFLAGYDYAAASSYDFKLLLNMLLVYANVPGYDYIWEYYGYAGILPIVMTIIGLTRIHTDRRIAVLAVITVLTILFMLGDHCFLFPILWKYVPGFNLFRAPARAIVIINFMIALFSALGLQATISWFSRRTAAHSAWLTVIILLACIITWFDITLAARANRERMFLPDHEHLEQPLHKLHEKVLLNDRSWYRYWFKFLYFRQNHAFAVEGRSIGGYDNMYLQRYSRFIHHMTDTPIVPSLVTILTQKTFTNTPLPFPFKILGVKYVDSDNKILMRDKQADIRRAWFVTKVRILDSESTALNYMRSSMFQPYQEVIFEAPEADKINFYQEAKDQYMYNLQALADIKVNEISPEHLHIEIGKHPAGYLVLSEIFYPGWRSVVDGHEVPIYRADSILRCIPLGKNAKQIDILFKPTSVRYGALVSFGFLILIVTGFWLTHRSSLFQ